MAKVGGRTGTEKGESAKRKKRGGEKGKWKNNKKKFPIAGPAAHSQNDVQARFNYYYHTREKRGLPRLAAREMDIEDRYTSY